MRVAVIGASGQLGQDLCRALGPLALPLSHADIEVASLESVKKALGRRLDVVINTAAFHRVDDCEDDPAKAFQVNAIGARNVAVVAQDIGAKLVHISTDYVFGGEAVPHRAPFTEFDRPLPCNAYGRSKLAGEDFVRHLCPKHFIVRTSGLFGVAGSSGKGGNFVETMLRLGKERNELKVVNDQVFSPTYTKDLADKLVELIGTEYYGILHVTNSGACSWYEFAREILRLAGLRTRVIPITSDQYPQKAKRPGYSVLGHFHLSLLNVKDLRPWQEALADYLKAKGHMK